MRRAVVFAAAFTLLALGSMSLADAGGCHPQPGSTEGNGVSVRVASCAFGPTILHAPVGATVTWSIADYLPHAINGIGWNATEPGAPAQPGSTVSHTFTDAGVYPYMCYLHPGMSGVVVVGDAALGGSAGGRAVTAPASTGPRSPVTAASSLPAVELPLAFVLVSLAALAGYAFAVLPRYRGDLDGAAALRRRHGVHAG